MVCNGADKAAERCESLREMVRLSASPSLKMKSNGASPLHRAAGTGAIEITKLLIELGAHVNAKNDAGATPLDAATKSSAKACH